MFSADIDAPLEMNRYNFPRLFSWACFIHPIKLSHQIQCIQLSVWYLILLKHQQQHRVWLMWIRSGSLNVFLVVMLNSDCSLHTSEESIDTTVKQSPSYLPVHNFPHLLKSACNEIGRGTFALFAKKKILWNFTAYWFKAVSSTFTLSCVRGFDLATSPLRVLQVTESQRVTDIEPELTLGTARLLGFSRTQMMSLLQAAVWCWHSVVMTNGRSHLAK